MEIGEVSSEALKRLEGIAERITGETAEEIRRKPFCQTAWYQAHREGRVYDSGYGFLRIRK